MDGGDALAARWLVRSGSSNRERREAIRLAGGGPSFLQRGLGRLTARPLVAVLAAPILFLAALELAVSVGIVTVESTDVGLYRRYGEAIDGGAVPYRDIAIEYPPGALPLFVGPAILTDSPASYRRVFAVLMVIGIVALLAGVRVLSVRLAAGDELTVVAPLVVLLLVALMGSVALTRFDVVPAALTVGALAAFTSGRRHLGAVVLGLAIVTKLYPAVLLPLVVVYVARRAGARAAGAVTAITLAVVALAYAPFVAWSPGGVEASLRAQLSRPLEIESLGGSLFVAAHTFFGLHLPKQSTYYELPFHSADVVAAVSVGAGLAVLLGIWILFAFSPQDPRSLLLFSAAAIAAFVGFGKVLSPQYLLWLIPLVALVPGRRGLQATAGLAAACLLTALTFPRHWEALKYGLGAREAAAMVLRDLLILGVLATLLWPRDDDQAAPTRRWGRQLPLSAMCPKNE